MNKTKQIDELDTKLLQIQRSTATSLPGFIYIHNWLRIHSQLYYNWHTNRLASPMHWTIFGLTLIITLYAAAIILIVFLILYLYFNFDALRDGAFALIDIVVGSFSK